MIYVYCITQGSKYVNTEYLARTMFMVSKIEIQSPHYVGTWILRDMCVYIYIYAAIRMYKYIHVCYMAPILCFIWSLRKSEIQALCEIAAGSPAEALQSWLAPEGPRGALGHGGGCYFIVCVSYYLLYYNTLY